MRIDKWNARSEFISFIEKSSLSLEAKRAVRLLNQEAGNHDREWERICREYIFDWKTNPPSLEILSKEIDELRDSSDAVDGGEWINEVNDWEMEHVPVRRGSEILGYAKEGYWKDLGEELRHKFETWLSRDDFDDHDEWLVRQALLYGRVRTITGFKRELEDVFDASVSTRPTR